MIFICELFASSNHLFEEQEPYAIAKVNFYGKNFHFQRMETWIECLFLSICCFRHIALDIFITLFQIVGVKETILTLSIYQNF